MSASKTNLQFFLTTTIPGPQSDASFSTGGYVSTTVMPVNFFNNSFNGQLKQYRCIAVQNLGTSDVFQNLKFYIKQTSINPAVTIRMAVEIPQTNAFVGSAYVPGGQIGSTISVVVTSLANVYADNYFDGCVLRFTSGMNINFQSIVNSYDGPSGTFTLTSSAPFNISNGDGIAVDPSPSQIVKSGTIEPQFGTTHVSALSTALGIGNSIEINVSGTRVNGNNLNPNEIVYLWFERTTSPNAPEFDNNSLIFTANYQT